MAIENSTILGKFLLEGSSDYMQRVPDALQLSYSEHVKNLFDPYNKDLFNVFTNMLNGIAATYVDGKTFYNPLRVLKKPAEQDSFGAVERHIAVDFIQARTYRADNEAGLLKYEPPRFSEWYYSCSEPRQYPFTWSRFDIRRAFSRDGYGFNDLLDRTIGSAISSDEYDEMLIMLHMITEADNSLDGGIYKHTLSAAPTNQATAQELLAAVRTYAGKFTFPNVIYNHLDNIPTFTNRENLVFFTTPEVASVIDVYALAAAFNRSDAEIQYRVIIVPEFEIPNMYGLLCDEDFLFARDAYYGIDSFHNPAQIADKYYLNHAAYYGVNPAACACAFVTAS